MQHLLIVGTSCRALAESTRLANFPIHTIDAFADEDTRALAITAQQTNYFNCSSDKRDLLEKIEIVFSEYPIDGIILGSGFEDPSSLAMFADMQCQNYANDREVVSVINDPIRFSELLNDCNISHPPTQMNPPENLTGYLIKPLFDNGGKNIVWASGLNAAAKQRVYFQKYVEGRVFSVVFLADATAVNIIGFSQLQQSEQFPQQPFLYAGAIAVSSADAAAFQEVESILTTLCKRIQLRGLCGIDFVVTPEGNTVVLEINPRPPASFELHQSEHSLIKAHIECFGSGAVVYQRCQTIKAYAIIYAKQSLGIPESASWPDWVKDRPTSGSYIEQNEPICTVHAEATSTDAARKQLLSRVNKIKHSINNIAHKQR